MQKPCRRCVARSACRWTRSFSMNKPTTFARQTTYMLMRSIDGTWSQTFLTNQLCPHAWKHVRGLCRRELERRTSRKPEDQLIPQQHPCKNRKQWRKMTQCSHQRRPQRARPHQLAATSRRPRACPCVSVRCVAARLYSCNGECASGCEPLTELVQPGECPKIPCTVSIAESRRYLTR